jgi:hypothetical protein
MTREQQEDLSHELMGLIAEVVTTTNSNIRSAIKRGWQPPAHWRERISTAVCGSGEDPDVWFSMLYAQFCEDVSFPDDWTVLEKVAMFGDLLLNRTGG